MRKEKIVAEDGGERKRRRQDPRKQVLGACSQDSAPRNL
jgi:hypothetical protein